MADSGEVISDILGWIYFFAWSISFYPQFLLNCRRKSVTGLSLEFQMYNLTGFTFYTIYTLTNFIQQRRLGLTESVTPQDIAFAVHAALITYATVVQCIIYKREVDTVNRYHVLLCIIFWVLSLYNVALSAGGILPWYTSVKADWNYNTVEFLGYVKAMISLVKYTPQAYMNWKRQSTVGWSIGNVMLDLTGGSLSFLQQFLDASRKDDWSYFTTNVPKLLLSVESVFFDLLFLFQHYVLYRDRSDPDDQQLVDPNERYDAARAVMIDDHDNDGIRRGRATRSDDYNE